MDVSVVIPLYNEAANFEPLAKRMEDLQQNFSKSLEVVLVDDGSDDETPGLMRNWAMKNPNIQCLFLSRNFGHQMALSSGLAYARGKEGVMLMDGDLQDPPELFFDFYEKFRNGCDVIYAIRENRQEGIWKRLAYKLFYRIQNQLNSIYIPLDTGDFSFLSRRVLDEVNKLPERQRYLRGLRSWVGFKQCFIKYQRATRNQGSSKYSLAKLFRLALDGIFSFSEFPVKLITRMGFFAIFFGLVYFGIVVIKKFFWGTVPEGFTTLIFIIVLFSGVQLISLGLIGEYVLRIYAQTLNRPLYIVDRQIKDGEEQNG
jgi:dolichol-phosphate mannosyltransferase